MSEDLDAAEKQLALIAASSPFDPDIRPLSPAGAKALLAELDRLRSPPAPLMVYCVMCLEQDGPYGTVRVHIFSTQEKAQAWADADTIDRAHIHYDYVVDHPERYEERSQ